MGPHYAWPTHADFHEEWPLLAEDLIVAEWRYDGAWLLNGVVQEIAVDLLDPPLPQRHDWRRLYAPELGQHVGVAYDLASRNPVAAIARRARMTPAETDVFRAWAAGSSLSTIARDLGRAKSTVQTLLERARFRLQALDRRGLVVRPPTEPVEALCGPPDPTSPPTSSPASSAMPGAS